VPRGAAAASPDPRGRMNGEGEHVMVQLNHVLFKTVARFFSRARLAL